MFDMIQPNEFLKINSIENGMIQALAKKMTRGGE